MKLPNPFARTTRTLTVGELMQTSVKTCRADESLNRAAQIMWDHDCGVVVVVDDDQRAVAIITDRDICMAAYTQDLPLSKMLVESAMSRQPRCCAAHDPLSVAESIMQAEQIRRLPVTDRDGRLLGLLSLSDIARHLDTHTAGATDVSGEELAATLCAICRPHSSSEERSGSARRSWPAGP